jgi:hypothetical protein
MSRYRQFRFRYQRCCLPCTSVPVWPDHPASGLDTNQASEHSETPKHFTSWKFLFQISAFKVCPHNLWDNRTIKVIAFGKTFIIDLFKPVEMVQ